jgi:hypothetical protein
VRDLGAQFGDAAGNLFPGEQNRQLEHDPLFTTDAQRHSNGPATLRVRWERNTMDGFSD